MAALNTSASGILVLLTGSLQFLYTPSITNSLIKRNIL
jgi:hypothetical protein